MSCAVVPRYVYVETAINGLTHLPCFRLSRSELVLTLMVHSCVNLCGPEEPFCVALSPGTLISGSLVNISEAAGLARQKSAPRERKRRSDCLITRMVIRALGEAVEQCCKSGGAAMWAETIRRVDKGVGQGKEKWYVPDGEKWPSRIMPTLLWKERAIDHPKTTLNQLPEQQLANPCPPHGMSTSGGPCGA